MTRARPMRCLCPPESPLPPRPSCRANRASASPGVTSPTATSAARSASSLASGAARRRLSATLPSIIQGVWLIQVALSARLAPGASSSPSTSTLPEAVEACPRSSFSNVVLPAPEGPVSATMAPGRALKLTPSSPAPLPKSTETLWNAMIGGVFLGGNLTGSARAIAASSQSPRNPAAAAPSARSWWRADSLRIGAKNSGTRIRIVMPCASVSVSPVGKGNTPSSLNPT